MKSLIVTPDFHSPDDSVKLYCGDCLTVLKEMPDCSVDSVVTDPPAGIAFLAADWDNPRAWEQPITKHGFTDGGNRLPAPSIGTSARNPMCRKCHKHKRGWKDVLGCQCEEPDFDDSEHRNDVRDYFVSWLTAIMRECLRVLKPGGHALVWALPRTSHWTALALEDAGFEVRDRITNFMPSDDGKAFFGSLTEEQLNLFAKLRNSLDAGEITGMFGSGFPKSLSIEKQLDRMAGRIDQDIIQIKKRLAELYDASGKTRQQIDEECGFRACNYLSYPQDGKRPDPWFVVLPSQEKWQTIKRVVSCDNAEIDASLDKWFVEAERIIVGHQTKARKTDCKTALPTPGETEYQTWDVTIPATEQAKKWQGWGSSLKPAAEIWWLCRKPLDGTIAQNVLKHGVGGLNIDACRVKGPKGDGVWGTSNKTCQEGRTFNASPEGEEYRSEMSQQGRWPSHVVFTHHEACECVGEKKVKPKEGYRPNPVNVQSDGNLVFTEKPVGYQKGSFTAPDGKETVEDWQCAAGCVCGYVWPTKDLTPCPDCGSRKTEWLCPVRMLDEQSGDRKTTWISPTHQNNRSGGFLDAVGHPGSQGYNDSGGASRFFYQAKPSRRERDEGCEGSNKEKEAVQGGGKRVGRNTHPT